MHLNILPFKKANIIYYSFRFLLVDSVKLQMESQSNVAFRKMSNYLSYNIIDDKINDLNIGNQKRAENLIPFYVYHLPHRQLFSQIFFCYFSFPLGEHVIYDVRMKEILCFQTVRDKKAEKKKKNCGGRMAWKRRSFDLIVKSKAKLNQ